MFYWFLTVSIPCFMVVLFLAWRLNRPRKLIRSSLTKPLLINNSLDSYSLINCLKYNQLVAKTRSKIITNDDTLLPTHMTTKIYVNSLAGKILDDGIPTTIKITSTYFTQDLFEQLNSYYSKHISEYLFMTYKLKITPRAQINRLISRKNACTVLYMIEGQMDVYLYPPQYSEYFHCDDYYSYSKNVSSLDLNEVNSVFNIPLLDDKTTLTEGQVLAIPKGWWYAIEPLDETNVYIWGNGETYTSLSKKYSQMLS